MDDMMITLQTVVQHQEEEISNLSKELFVQQKEIQLLKQQMAVLIDRFRSLRDAAEGGADGSAEPPPPHY